MGAFRCVFRTSLSEYDHGGLYLAAYEGDIHVFTDEERERLAGHARLFVLNADGAERDGQSLFNLLDIRPETAVFIPLLGDEDGALAPAVCDVLAADVRVSRNMLLLESLEIEPPFRGQQLGLKYVAAAITRFGLGCRLVAVRPVPPPWAERFRDAAPRRGTQRAAKMRLRRYCTRAGFVALPRSDLMILDLQRQRQDAR